MVAVSGRALGRKKPLFADWSVPLPPEFFDSGDGGRTLRELIAQIVRAEVDAFCLRQERRKLTAVLSATQIEEGAEKGKVDMGGRDLEQEVDVEAAIATALEAFEDGLYLVVLDGEEQRDLDRQVFVTPESQITFVRLVMMAGG